MGRKKLERYMEVKKLPNYYDVMTAPKQHWNEWAFKEPKPIVLELGCGNGEYVVNLAKLDSSRNFIGVDVKAERMYVGLREVNQTGIRNAAFLRTPVQFIPDFFAPSEVDELWITFPDPFLKGKKHRRRLTSAFFLDVYRKVLKPGGVISFKTDCDPLFEYTLEVLAEQGDKVEVLYQSFDLHRDVSAKEEWLIKTKYETKYHALNIPTKFVQFRLW